MTTISDICAVILAAGDGIRFGYPKIFAQISGKYTAKSIVHKLVESGISDYTIVVSVKNYGAAKSLMDLKFSINEFPENGMLSSIRIGIISFPDAEGYMIIPVDHPFVEIETYQILIDCFEQNKNKIIRPICNNKHGHPIIIPHDLAVIIPHSDIDGGLAQLIKVSSFPIIDVEVSDTGILRNVNYPDDL